MNESINLIVQGGQVVLPDRVACLDIGIRDGTIIELAEMISPTDHLTCRVISAEGKYVFPGTVDVHVHFNEPGLGSWEGFTTGSSALAKGGCTTFIDMPLNGRPPTVTCEALELKLLAAREHSFVDYALWGGLVPGNMDHLQSLDEAGVAGFKAFMSNPGGEGEDIFREIDDWTLYEGMRIIAKLGAVLALHAESEPLVSRLTEQSSRSGKQRAMDYAASRPIVAELEAVHRALFYAEQTGCALHFVHISSPQAVEAIDQAKRQGLDVTVETCPHYLVLTAEEMEVLGPVAKCAPPLRSAYELQGLWEAISAEKIDVIASDHSPCPPEMKATANWFEAWGGISGAQSTLELMIAEGYVKRGIGLPLLARLMSENPAKRFGLSRKGVIGVGYDADLAIVEIGSGYTLSADHLRYRHPHSPYIGRSFPCRITSTLLRGQLIYDADDTHSAATTCLGRWIPKKAGTTTGKHNSV